MLPFQFQHTVQWPSVKPYRQNAGPPRVPPPTSDAVLPLEDEMLERLEEWGFRDGGDSFGDLALRAEVLQRLEKEICLDNSDHDARPTSREPGTGPPQSTSDREHPLWDRDLDG